MCLFVYLIYDTHSLSPLSLSLCFLPHIFLLSLLRRKLVNEFIFLWNWIFFKSNLYSRPETTDNIQLEGCCRQFSWWKWSKSKHHCQDWGRRFVRISFTFEPINIASSSSTITPIGVIQTTSFSSLLFLLHLLLTLFSPYSLLFFLTFFFFLPQTVTIAIGITITAPGTAPLSVRVEPLSSKSVRVKWKVIVVHSTSFFTLLSSLSLSLFLHSLFLVHLFFILYSHHESFMSTMLMFVCCSRCCSHFIHQFSSSLNSHFHLRSNSRSLVSAISQAPKHIESFGSITGYYIGYKVLGSEKPYTFKTIESNHLHSKPLEAIVTNLKKSTMYTFSVQAFNTKGAGPASSEVTGKTLDKDPPSPPRLRVISTTATSVSLGWTSNEDTTTVNGKHSATLCNDSSLDQVTRSFLSSWNMRHYLKKEWRKLMFLLLVLLFHSLSFLSFFLLSSLDRISCLPTIKFRRMEITWNISRGKSDDHSYDSWIKVWNQVPSLHVSLQWSG